MGAIMQFTLYPSAALTVTYDCLILSDHQRQNHIWENVKAVELIRASKGPLRPLLLLVLKTGLLVMFSKCIQD